MINRPTTELLVGTYLRAKDENRPHLLSQAFAEDACLEMTVKTGAISFPPVSKGLPSIADVLVRQFNQTYENVYSFCLQRPAPGSCADRFECGWLVVMSEKKDRNVRVGCGRYDWRFQTEAPYLVERLKITIEAMQTLPPERLQPVLGWATKLSYPWCSGEAMATTIPQIDGLEPVIEFIARK